MDLRTWGEEEHGMNLEISSDTYTLYTYTLLCVKQVTHGKLLCNIRSSAWRCEDREAWDGDGSGEAQEKRDVYTHMYMYIYIYTYVYVYIQSNYPPIKKIF